MNQYSFNNIDLEQRCTAYISLQAIQHNFNLIAQTVAPAKVIAVIKANAYGHGAVAVAQALSGKAVLFAVATFGEALQLREANIREPILILGHVHPSLAAQMALHNIDVTVHTLEQAYLLSNNLEPEQKLNVHIKIDTGMGRLGFAASDSADILKLWQIKGLNPVGLFTHLAVADSVELTDRQFTLEQYQAFVQVKKYLQAHNKSLFCHVSNSIAAIRYPEFRADAVRAGVLLYGLSPDSTDTQLISKIRPAMTLKARISEIKQVCTGSFISYGRTYCASKNVTVATITAGYADGYPRLLSSTGTVAIKATPANVVGRVCMDQLMVDVSHLQDVSIGDEVTLFGGSEGADSVDDVARKCQTINYEIVAGIASRVHKHYL